MRSICGIGGLFLYRAPGNRFATRTRGREIGRWGSVEMRGRKPKPTRVKELEGNPGKRRLPKREPRPRGAAVAPAWLGAERAVLGARVTGQLDWLTPADERTLAAYCVASGGPGGGGEEPGRRVCAEVRERV